MWGAGIFAVNLCLSICITFFSCIAYDWRIIGNSIFLLWGNHFSNHLYLFQSSEVAEIMPLSSFSQKFRPRLGLVTPPRPLLPKLEPGSVGANSPALSLTNDPILAQSPLKSKISMDDTLGGFPVKCLVQIVRGLYCVVLYSVYCLLL